jgi:hypothetical protein
MAVALDGNDRALDLRLIERGDNDIGAALLQALTIARSSKPVPFK